MTPERLAPVLEAGLDKINISVDGMNRGQYRKFTGFDFDFESSLKTSNGCMPTKACEVAD